jgi:hypothetical protein
MKKLLFVIIVLLVAVLLIMTRPAKEAHKEAMMKAVKEYVDEEAEQRGFGSGSLTQIGKSVVTKVIETALSSKLELHDYYLLNTTTVRLNGDDKLLSVGVLGHVFTFDKDKLREKLEEASRTKEVQAIEKAAAKEEAKQMKELLREQRKMERAERKAARKAEREAKKEQRRKEKEAKQRAKEAAKKQ